MPIDDAVRWNRRYNDPKSGPKEPDRFLVSCMKHLPPGGLALDVAMGQGRNALFLARRGWRVIGLDISCVGVREAVVTARSMGLPVFGAVVDLARWWLPPSYFDLVVNVRYLERSLVGQLKRTLKPGGYVLFDTLALKPGSESVDEDTTGFPLDYLLHPGELAEWFGDFEVIEYDFVDHFSPNKPYAGQEALLARKP